MWPSFIIPTLWTTRETRQDLIFYRGSPFGSFFESEVVLLFGSLIQGFEIPARGTLTSPLSRLYYNDGLLRGDPWQGVRSALFKLH